ncbi:Similar to Ttll2: Probable tubulin polyglutamylase TTLL2 (Mus musculus) [Cotesia congregata]|uniref:Similar to Ttll2: Probable tubulin polyglutamylase TTLL2 (Mus musculus) n=1 Tax=Cotesia congregata TaxID=51543 RepID=A0A8J2HUB9_COTCN|nr:Similar to Ttll2: Probable tubulin polyglutamylase TTLL2 (Mus musculus) [Cotesia congregata]
MNDKYLDGPFVFRINDNGGGPNLLVQVCIERGWREYTGDNSSLKDRWNLWWKSGGFSSTYYKNLLPGQFINRIPKGSSICKKDNLVRHLKCMRQIYGNIYDISPVGYNLPSEYTKLAADCSRSEKDERVWICKPVGQSQGRGIFLFRRLSDLTYDSTAVVQKYIEKPLLIGGYKFDLRLYVCVPSYRPLVIYIYNEGLARFATSKFSLDNLSDPFRHLTNFALNKLGPGYSQKKERVGAGSKWSFRQLRRYMNQSGFHDWFLWQRIACLITLTILSQTAGIPETSNCFEFFGFDVLIDADLKPWLLEVNISPALGNDCEVDFEVKKPLLHDLFDLLGLPVCNTGLSLFKIWSTTPNNQSIDNDYCASKYYKSRCSGKPLVNICSNNRDIFRHSNADENYGNSCSRYNFLCLEKSLRQRLNSAHKLSNNHPGTFVWDNGRDWSNPKIREGGWIRTYPFTNCKLVDNVDFQHPINTRETKTTEREIKNNVLSVQKFIKVAKDINRDFGKYGDERCNQLLRQELELTSEIWLPNK